MVKDLRSMCSGCVDDFYNDKNPYGVKECWCLKTAEVCQKKFIPLDMVPPWNVKPVKTLSCYKKKGYVKVDPKVMR